MALKKGETTHIEAVSNRNDFYIVDNVQLMVVGDDYAPAPFYLDTDDAVQVLTAGGQTVTLDLVKGFVPIRITKVVAATANVFRLY
jgi:hypothetical protein